METFFVCLFIFVYVWSVILSGFYFVKKNYTAKMIYCIAAFMPIWNTYFAIKYFAFDHDGSLIKAIKFHFTWEE